MSIEDDYEEYCKFKEWRKHETHHMGIIEPIPKQKQKQPNILVPIHYVWAAAAGAIVLLIAAWPFTLLGFFIGLFVRIKFFGDK